MIYLRLRFMGYIRFRFGERFIDFLFFRIEIFFIFFMDFLIEVEIVHAIFYQVAFLDIGSDGMSQNTTDGDSTQAGSDFIGPWFRYRYRVRKVCGCIEARNPRSWLRNNLCSRAPTV